MGFENKDKKIISFGKFGQITIRKTDLPKNEEAPQETSLSALSSTGKVIGSVSIAAAGIYIDEVHAGATGIPY